MLCGKLLPHHSFSRHWFPCTRSRASPEPSFWLNRGQRGWWQSPHHQSWELLSRHVQDYLLLTRHQDPSDVLHCCFWHSCSPLPRLFATFRRFDCPPAWEQKPGLLISGHRGSPRTATGLCQAWLPSPRSPSSPLSRKSQVLLLQRLPSTQTLQNTLSKQWCHHKKPVNGTK